MDALLAAERLPKLADRAMRDAITIQATLHGRPTLRALVDTALRRFEFYVQCRHRDGVRPALLFAQRDRIVTCIRRFTGSRLAKRLERLERCEITAAGIDASPFDIIVRARNGALHAIVLRTLAHDARRLDSLRLARLLLTKRNEVASVLLYDLESGRVRALRRKTRTLAA